jgi:hypothetical protein
MSIKYVKVVGEQACFLEPFAAIAAVADFK